ncbi:MAG: Ldh family oxidoreductase [Pseudomonadota bacterium]
MPVVVSHAALQDFTTECYVAMGLAESDARLIADTLVQADLWGHQSHGVMRLFWYAARITSRATNTDATPVPEGGLGALATMDGQEGMGQIVASAAMTHAIALSKQHGIGAVAVRNSGHFGTAMYFTKMAADAGCVGFLSTNASPAMAPWGGTEKRVGTNPWSWAAPAGRHPTIMLDIANTAVARGKLYLAKQRGENIPPDWAIDADGRATTDPAAGIAGTILPMAGHKGYAISTLMDVLSGVLSGSQFGTSVVGPYVPNGTSGVGHLVLAIDIEAARGLAAFEADMERLIAELKATPRRPDTPEIFYPGELEARSAQTLRAEGIALPDDTATELRAKAADHGVTAPF